MNGAVLAHALRRPLARLGRLFERLDRVELVAALVHDQFDEGVAGAGGRRRAEDLIGWSGRPASIWLQLV